MRCVSGCVILTILPLQFSSIVIEDDCFSVFTVAVVGDKFTTDMSQQSVGFQGNTYENKKRIIKPTKNRTLH